MFESFSQSWQLLKQSAGILTKDKELLVFPIISGIITIILMITFFVPIFLTAFFGQTNQYAGIITYALVFLFYFISYFVVVFFNTALVGAAMVRLKGGDPTIGDGFKIAFSNLLHIILWSLVGATIGMILNVLLRRSRNNFFANIAVGLIGASWSIASFLVIPVMVAENKGPFSSLRRSVEKIKNKWGAAIAGPAGIGLVFFIATILAIILAVGFSMVLPQAIPIWVGLAILIIVMLSVVSSALNGIFTAAVYSYASQGNQIQGVDAQLLENAVR
ncbi:MAG: DUF6159 family protein [archaeon]